MTYFIAKNHFICDYLNFTSVCQTSTQTSNKVFESNSVKMTLPEAFYEGAIYATAEEYLEKKGLTKSSSTTEDRYESVKTYTRATKQILTILKNESKSNWDLRSIKQKVDFLPNRTLNDSEIQLILDSLVDQRYVLEHQSTNDSETPVYYSIPLSVRQLFTGRWYDILADALVTGILVYIIYSYTDWKFRYLQRKYGPHSFIPYM